MATVSERHKAATKRRVKIRTITEGKLPQVESIFVGLPIAST